MQRFLSRYALAAHLAILAVAPFVLCAFCAPLDIAKIELWLSLLTMLWMLLEPSRRADERLADARKRVWKALYRDGFFYVQLAVVVIAGLRALNSGVRLGYDGESGLWLLRGAWTNFLPASGTGGEGWLYFSVAVAALVIVQACRHALGKSARFALLLTMASLVGMAAMVTVSQAVAAATDGHIGVLASWQTPAFAGSVCGLAAVVSVVALFAVYTNGWKNCALWLLFAIGGSLTGLFFMAPASVVAIYLIAFVMMWLLLVGYLLAFDTPQAVVKCLVALVMAALIPCFFIVAFAKAGLFLSQLQGFTAIMPKDSEAGGLLADVAYNAWKASPWTGSGIATFVDDLRLYLDSGDWAVLGWGCNAPYSLWWLVASERGLIGALLIVVTLSGLIWTYFYRAVQVKGFKDISPLAWLGVVVLGVVGFESFIDVSALRAEMMLMVVGILATTASAFSIKKIELPEGEQSHG